MTVPGLNKKLRKVPLVLVAIAGALQLPDVQAFLGGAAIALKWSGALTLLAAAVRPLVEDVPPDPAPAVEP